MVGEGDSTSYDDLWRDRLAVLTAQSAWLAAWGPKPGNPTAGRPLPWHHGGSGVPPPSIPGALPFQAPYVTSDKGAV